MKEKYGVRPRFIVWIAILILLGAFARWTLRLPGIEPLDKDAIYAATSICLPDKAKIVVAKRFPYRGPKYVQVVADVSSVDIDQLLECIPRTRVYDFDRYDTHVPSLNDSSAYGLYKSRKDLAALHFERAFDPSLGVRNPKPGKKFIFANLCTKAKDNNGELIYLNILIQVERDGRRYLYLTGNFD